MRCYMNGIYRDSDSQIYGLMLRQFVDRIVIFGRDFYEAELDHQLLEGSEFALLLADLVLHSQDLAKHLKFNSKAFEG